MYREYLTIEDDFRRILIEKMTLLRHERNERHLTWGAGTWIVQFERSYLFKQEGAHTTKKNVDFN